MWGGTTQVSINNKAAVQKQQVEKFLQSSRAGKHQAVSSQAGCWSTGKSRNQAKKNM